MTSIDSRPAGRGRRRAWGALLLLAWAAGAAAQPAGPAEPTGATPQARGVWRFLDDGVAFDNRQEGARAGGVRRAGEGRYGVAVTPETQPINPSPWYGFRVGAQRPRTVEIALDYGAFRHRYRPWLRREGEPGWRAAGEDEFAIGDDGVARLALALDGRDVEVFAQPPIGIGEVERWAAALAARVGAQVETIGRSVQGRPLPALAFGEPTAPDLVLVLGRQHPPEITGMRALLAFVEALAGDDARARDFRARHRVLVLPLLNPDGVAEGHWRGNARGVDLNRDWGPFREPETRAAAAAIARHLDGGGRRLAFAIDFHSTWYDILYTVTEDPSRAPGGLLRGWMDDLRARFPDRIQERPGPAAGSAVFKNWAFRAYGAPVVTYEVGDATGEAETAALAGFAAERLMARLAAPGAAP
ncbi:M14 family metallopeptidase [Luteimonas sp. Y-2-2-4F]|nr:M14 family metallopeptidase [Luteimonas sp. Y-2-2-4F]